MLCSYGCGDPGLFPLKNGKMCCSDHYNKCPANRAKNSAAAMGHRDRNPSHPENVKRIRCQYCNDIYSSAGIKSHEHHCYMNPRNRRDCQICNSPIKNYRDNKTCSSRCGSILGKHTISNGETKTDYRRICFEHHGRKCLVCDEDLFTIAHHVNGDRTNNEPINLLPFCHTHHLYIHHKEYRYILKECVDEYLEMFVNR